MSEDVMKVLEPGELRPCPFCGGVAERHDLDDDDNAGGSVIECTKCGASSSVHFDRKENLDASWNDRLQSSSPSSGGGETVALEAWIEREFAGYGMALNFDDVPELERPVMSMRVAKELVRRAVAEFAHPSSDTWSSDWVLVPREATAEMLAEGDSAIPQFALDDDGSRLMGVDGLRDAWAAMLASRPPVATTPGSTEDKANGR